MEDDWPEFQGKVMLEQSLTGCFNFSVGKQMYTWDHHAQGTSRGNESQLQLPHPAQHQVTWIYLSASISKVVSLLGRVPESEQSKIALPSFETKNTSERKATCKRISCVFCGASKAAK